MQLATIYSERVDTIGGTSSASFSAASSPVLASTGFTIGKKYLILARSEVGQAVVGAVGGVKLMHGATEFPGSAMAYDIAQSINDKIPYFYFTVWTAVASEDVTLHVKGDGVNSMSHRFSTLLALRLSDDLIENTDWFYNEDTADHQLTTTYVTGATLTWTPGTAGHKWLVLSSARLTCNIANDQFYSRLDRTGEATGQWEVGWPGRRIGNEWLVPRMWVGTLGAASQTFREQAKRSGTTNAAGIRDRSAVFALNLSLMDVASILQTDTHLDAGVGQWVTQAGTVAHSQAIDNGKVLVLGALDFDPAGDSGSAQRNFTARVQQSGVDAYSVDGAVSTYSGVAGYHRFVYPVTAASAPTQTWPYMHLSLETMPAGIVDVDLDCGISANPGGLGVKQRRIAVLSLDVVPPAGPPPGAGGSPGVERNDQIMYQFDYRADRRRVMVRCVDATDNATPEALEAGGQPSISKNGAAFITTGVGVLVAVDAANGLYYTEIAQSSLDALGSLRVRYKSAATALFTATLPVEECPWLYDGAASGGGANYVDLSSPPATLQPGALVRIVANTGAGQELLAKTYASPRVTMEANWPIVAPDATSIIVIQPGLPPTVPDVNVAQINQNVTAAVRLAKGAEAILPATVVAGVSSQVQITCDLPITVGGVSVGANFYAGRGVIIKTGPLAGDAATINGSATSGANTILTLDSSLPLSGVPGVGVEFIVT